MESGMYVYKFMEKLLWKNYEKLIFIELCILMERYFCVDYENVINFYNNLKNQQIQIKNLEF